MNAMNRRDWLRAAAASSTLAAMGLTAGCGGDQKKAEEDKKLAAASGVSLNRFNVVVHGMAAAVIDRAAKMIRLTIPHVDDHAYGIGAFGQESLLMRPTPKMPASHDYTLQIKTTATDFQVDPAQDAVIDLMSKIKPNYALARHVISLPYPDYSEPLARMRTVLASSPPAGSFFSGTYAGPPSMPLAYAFSYMYDPKSPPAIPGLNWDVSVGKNPNLHIWCGPAFSGAAASHFQAATDAFNAIFNNQTSLAPGTAKPGVAASDHDNIPSTEQLSIGEARAATFRSADTSDCWLVFLDNPMA